MPTTPRVSVELERSRAAASPRSSRCRGSAERSWRWEAEGLAVVLSAETNSHSGLGHDTIHLIVRKGVFVGIFLLLAACGDATSHARNPPASPTKASPADKSSAEAAASAPAATRPPDSA